MNELKEDNLELKEWEFSNEFDWYISFLAKKREEVKDIIT
jgi:hypothetical protein